MVAYLLVLVGVGYGVASSPDRDRALYELGGLLGFLVTIIGLVRTGHLRHGFFAPLLYRVAIYAVLLVSYFVLGRLLPLMNHAPVDEKLYALDLTLFGFEPALAMERWVNPVTTEWFAFFYLSYFGLLAFVLIPLVLGARDQRLLGELGCGIVLAFCLGHVGYLLVPGFGPYWALAARFERQLPSGPFMGALAYVVSRGGAKMDIFPSIHTAVPTLLVLYLFRHRGRVRPRWAWLIVAGLLVNIIPSTMFLRWHYLIDVVAGLVVAGVAFAVSVVVTRRELERRGDRRTECWPSFRRAGAAQESGSRLAPTIT